MECTAGIILAFTIMVQNLHGRDPDRPVSTIMGTLFLKKTKAKRIKVSPAPPYYNNKYSVKATSTKNKENVWHEVAASLDTFFFTISFLFVIITTFTFLVIGML